MGVGAGAAAAIGGGIAATGSVAGSVISASGAESAASKASSADTLAAELTQGRYDTTRSDLSPYTSAGQSELTSLTGMAQPTQNILNTQYTNTENAIPTVPTQATIANMPGYQWSLDQGLKALQSQETAQGKGLSGAATKAAENYGTGLAQKYLGKYFNMSQTQFSDQSTQMQNAINKQNTVYNMLYGPASLGENAAAMTGISGASLASTASQALQASGNAQATGTSSAANSLASGINNAANTAASAYQSANYLGTGANNPNNSLYYGSDYSYNPVASGYTAGGAGTSTLQSLGFYTPLSSS